MMEVSLVGMRTGSTCNTVYNILTSTTQPGTALVRTSASTVSASCGLTQYLDCQCSDEWRDDLYHHGTALMVFQALRQLIDNIFGVGWATQTWLFGYNIEVRGPNLGRESNRLSNYILLCTFKISLALISPPSLSQSPHTLQRVLSTSSFSRTVTALETVE
ncbi:hypothetical protein BS17DRAFT_244576 [Gyrodon lividus]|nr:hypothetical protein BS17DRAFT_244576 [Gyrodon lividus]